MTSTTDLYPSVQQLVDGRTAIGLDGQPVEVTGESSVNNLRVIRHLVETHQARHTLEVGLAYGASALTFLQALRANGDDFCHTAIDPFQMTAMHGAGLRAIEDGGFKDHLQFHEQPSCTALPKMLSEGRKFDLIYIDGSHLFEDVFMDAVFSVHMLRPRGLCLFDDCTDPHIAKVLQFLKTNYEQFVVSYPLHGVIDKPIHKRIANRLGHAQLKAFEKVAQPPRAWDSRLGRF